MFIHYQNLAFKNIYVNSKVMLDLGLIPAALFTSKS
jgi:hypothetical protein